METSTDLAFLLAVASSLRDKPLPDDVVVFGEVGLSGEIRGVNGTDQRINEAARLGFKKCIVPAISLKKLDTKNFNIEIIGVRTISEAIKNL